VGEGIVTQMGGEEEVGVGVRPAGVEGVDGDGDGEGLLRLRLCFCQLNRKQLPYHRNQSS
jgi:hypothetical protein